MTLEAQRRVVVTRWVNATKCVVLAWRGLPRSSIGPSTLRRVRGKEQLNPGDMDDSNVHLWAPMIASESFSCSHGPLARYVNAKFPVRTRQKICS